MGLFQCLSPPRSASFKSLELHQLRAQLAEAQATISNLKAKQQEAAAAADGAPPAPVTTSIRVQVQPPVACESCIPRPNEPFAALLSGAKLSLPLALPLFLPTQAPVVPQQQQQQQQQGPKLGVAACAAATGTSAAAAAGGGSSSPISPGAPKSPKPAAPHKALGPSVRQVPSEFKAHQESRTTARPGLKRSQSARAPAPSPSSTAAPAAPPPPATASAASAAAVTPAGTNAALPAGPERPQSSSQIPQWGVAPPAAAGSRSGSSSSNARPEVLVQQLKVAEAFRQSLEAELREARFKAAALQTQVLSLQSQLEQAVEAQVGELDALGRLRQQVGPQLQQELEALRQRLEVCEADRTATKEQLSAAQADMARLTSQLATQKAISDSSQAELLALSAAHSSLKQDHSKQEAELQQRGQLVQLAQQELADMAYLAAAGRVALRLCVADTLQSFSVRAAPLTPRCVDCSPAAVALPVEALSSSQCAALQAAMLGQQGAAKQQGSSTPANTSGNDGSGGSGSSSSSEHGGSSIPASVTAAAAAAGAAAAIAAGCNSPRAPAATAAIAEGADSSVVGGSCDV